MGHLFPLALFQQGRAPFSDGRASPFLREDYDDSKVVVTSGEKAMVTDRCI